MFNGVLFQQSLQDLVKGIRAHRRDESAHIRDKMAEIAKECRSKDIAVKTTAVLKLTHLQMMGCNMSFASFYIVEVMSASDFATKRIGYLAAAQSFSPTTDVLLLTTNQFKKDLTNGRMQDCSQALTCLGKLVTESLACDLQHDVSLLLSSPRPYIRKKTLLVLYRFIMVYPETLAMISDKFRMCLQDPDPGVVCAAVTVTCELARSSPRDFLGLAPALYSLLTSSTNNWMLIKIVKLMGVLTPLEPRLGKKLVGPLTSLMRATRAKSLLYECCCTVSLGLMDYPEAVKLCCDRLSEFMVDTDQNLKYLGLLSMRRVVKAHPAVAMQHRDLILDCLDDVDIGIRMRALELVSEFVTRRTLRDIARILLRKLRASNESIPVLQPTGGFDGAESSIYAVSESGTDVSGHGGHALDPETPYRDALAEQLLAPGKYVRGEGYPILSSGDDFAWYIATVLGGLARTPGLSRRVYETVSSQLTELIARVEAVRPATLAVAAALLSATVSSKAMKRTASTQSASTPSQLNSASTVALDGEGNGEAAGSMDDENEDSSGILMEPPSPGPAASEKSDAPEVPPLSPYVVSAAAWVLGEHAELLKERSSIALVLMEYPVDELPCSAHVSVLGAAVKVYSMCKREEAEVLYSALTNRLAESLNSDFAEVHERAYLFKRLVEDVGIAGYEQLRPLFSGTLLPVDGRAQFSVKVPEGLNLEVPLLDTGGEDLFSFLTGDSSYTEDDPMANDIDGDEDDLFKQLENSGDLTFGSAKAPARVSSGAEPSGNNPYYLGGGEGNAQGVGNGHASSDRNAEDLIDTHDDLLGVKVPSADVFGGEMGPVEVLVDKDEERERRQPRTSPRNAGSSTNPYGVAFEGLFDTRSKAAPSKRADGEKDKRRKKKKKKKKGAAEHGDASLRDTSAPQATNLIDFDTIATESSPTKDSIPSPIAGAPAHLGQQDDLLL